MLIESSAIIDLSRLQELLEKLADESEVVNAIAQLQRQLDQWLASKSKNDSDDRPLASILLQLDQVNQMSQQIENQDIRQRIEISVNNIRHSICHEHLNIAAVDSVAVGT